MESSWERIWFENKSVNQFLTGVYILIRENSRGSRTDPWRGPSEWEERWGATFLGGNGELWLANRRRTRWGQSYMSQRDASRTERSAVSKTPKGQRAWVEDRIEIIGFEVEVKLSSVILMGQKPECRESAGELEGENQDSRNRQHPLGVCSGTEEEK